PVDDWQAPARRASRPRKDGLPQGRALGLVFAEAVEGLDLLFESVDRMVHRGLGLLVLGPVGASCQTGLVVAQRRHKGRFLHREDFSEDEAREAIAAADFLILPGRPAPLSPWLPRALSAGLGIIALRSPGLPAYTMPWPDGAGFFFHPASADALSDATAAALSALDQAGREGLAEAARRREFTARAEAEAYAALFAGLVRR
ncbi:MAG: hypothetical protein N2322_07550, partial [Terrimicrobiaceae bacterium]|nr:hypothetical protein [Terrimicrobiaceae bacterium]